MDRLKRVTADYLNSQKRLERRADERVAYAIESFARELLLVADDLWRAIKAAREHQPDGTVSAGLELVEKHLDMVLARHGITADRDEGRRAVRQQRARGDLRRSDGPDGARPRGRGIAARVPPARPSAAAGAGQRQRGQRITRFRFSPTEEDSMPTYEYECDACGHRFEDFQQMSDAPLKSLPEMPQAQAPPTDRLRRRADFQGHRLLPDRLSLEAIQRRQVQGRSERGARGVRHEEMRLVPEERSLEEQGMTDGTLRQ